MKVLPDCISPKCISLTMYVHQEDHQIFHLTSWPWFYLNISQTSQICIQIIIIGKYSDDTRACYPVHVLCLHSPLSMLNVQCPQPQLCKSHQRKCHVLCSVFINIKCRSVVMFSFNKLYIMIIRSIVILIFSVINIKAASGTCSSKCFT